MSDELTAQQDVHGARADRKQSAQGTNLAAAGEAPAGKTYDADRDSAQPNVSEDVPSQAALVSHQAARSHETSATHHQQQQQHPSSAATGPSPPRSTPQQHSAEAAPKGVPPPHFVAPSSYLRPLLSRAPAATDPPSAGSSPTGSRPGTRESRRQMTTPLDREQIEGLVSF